MKGAKFVSYHEHWTYFAHRFGLVYFGTIELRPGAGRGARRGIRPRKDGTMLVVLDNARCVRDPAGRIAGYEGTIVDITERKRAEPAMFPAKERAQVTLQAIGDAVITTDAMGRIDHSNPVAEASPAGTATRREAR